MDQFCVCSQNSTVVGGASRGQHDKSVRPGVLYFGHVVWDNYEDATAFKLGQGLASREGHLGPFGSVTGGGGYGKINDHWKSLLLADLKINTSRDMEKNWTSESLQFVRLLSDLC